MLGWRDSFGFKLDHTQIKLDIEIFIMLSRIRNKSADSNKNELGKESNDEYVAEGGREYLEWARVWGG